MLFASGSPYKAVEFEGKVYEPGQGNNMYIFPGIGMGSILSKARHVTDAMVEQASIALAGSLSADEVAAERRTINYEVTTALRSRLPRLHREGA